MSRNIIKYLFYAALLVFICYNSVYFKKLDEVKSEGTASKFNAADYARNYYEKLLPVADSAIEITALLEMLKADPGKAFEQYSNALGIGNIRYFLVQGKAKIDAVNESNLAVTTYADEREKPLIIATEFIYGNAIRDASGIVKLNEFTSTTDLNNVSAEVNEIVRTEVVPPVKTQTRAGDTISFTGAIQLNKRFVQLEDIEVIPISITLNK